MIEIFKLANLPKTQRTRKILRILETAENSLLENRKDEFLDPFYLSRLLRTVIEDLAENEQPKIQSWIENPCEEQKHEIINFARHALYKAADLQPSEWDLILPDSAPYEIASFRRKFFKNIFVYAEDIRTPFNIGSIFRTAESFGAEKIFLSEHCISPENTKAKRTAMGCTEYLPYSRASLDELPVLPVFALETGGVSINDFIFPKEGIVLIGSEELGLSSAALKKANAGIVSIPMYGIKVSLNVSVAFGILMQKWTEQIVKTL